MIVSGMSDFFLFRFFLLRFSLFEVPSVKIVLILVFLDDDESLCLFLELLLPCSSFIFLFVPPVPNSVEENSHTGAFNVLAIVTSFVEEGMLSGIGCVANSSSLWVREC